MTTTTVDRMALETKVKSMYSDVAANPHGEFHFEMGRVMAERLGTIGYLKAYIEDTGLAAGSADCVTDLPLPENVVCNADLWAACIGGAAQRLDYSAAIESAGLRVEQVQENSEYRFISERAQKATAKWGVKSVSILAIKR